MVSPSVVIHRFGGGSAPWARQCWQITVMSGMVRSSCSGGGMRLHPQIHTELVHAGADPPGQHQRFHTSRTGSLT
jgi:hypothetical protein